MNFITDFSEMCKKIFKSFTIISSFVKTDLIFYNSEKVLTLLHKKIERLKSLTSSFFSSSSIASTWSTSQTIFRLCQYAADLCDIWNYLEMSTLFCQWFDYFVNFSVVRAISDLNAEKSLRECKKKTIKCAKYQSDTRKVIQKDEVLKTDKDSEWIISRCLNEVEQARQKTKLKSRHEKSRKTLECQLDVLTALNDSNRSISCAEQAVSV